MPNAHVNGTTLAYEEAGDGLPLVFVHEWGGDAASWEPQVRVFARRYRTITFNARGYPPSEVPREPSAYSQAHAVDDIRGLLDHLGIHQAHVCGLSMGGYATLLFGLTYPERARSLAVCGCGYGSGGDRAAFQRSSLELAERLEQEGMPAVAETYARGATRVQFMVKDPRGWDEFRRHLAAGSATGRALTLRGVQTTRPSIFDLEDRLKALTVPTLVVVGDEDDPALDPSVFIKRKVRTAGLVVIPNSGHTVNLEEPAAFNRCLLDFLTAVDAGRWPVRHPTAWSA
ncbi:MAG: alpha/beta fold hydrolase [Candidatus Methylomirabilales bacterium]